MTDWIACSDRLPDLENRVLAIDDDGDINVAFRTDDYNDDIIWTYYDYMEWHHVIAWMPLPNPPKGEE